MLALPVGTELAGYRIESVAGRGGMGVVYRATDIALDRSVALKLIADEYASDQIFRERFKRESRLAAAIRHPSVVTVFRAGEEGDRLYIAMDFVEGTDLKSMLGERGALAPKLAADIVTQVASALDAAHAEGLVHRDVKPANVLLASDGDRCHAYLTDFGLTKHMASGSAMTETGAFVGTVDYAAPEQLNGIRVDARTDVYSLACVLYHAVTGEVPYPRDSTMAKMYAHVQEPAPSVLAIAPRAPAGLEEVVKRGMAKTPEERYESAGAMAEAVLSAVERRDVDRPVAPRAARGRFRPVMLTAVAVLLIAAAVALVLALAGGGGVTTEERDRYQDAVLDAYRPVTALIVQVEPQIPQRVDDPQDQLSAGSALARVRNAMNRAIATMRKTPIPEDVRDLHARVIAVFTRMRGHVADAVAAADFGNTRDFQAASEAFVADGELLDPLAPEFRARGYARLGQPA